MNRTQDRESTLGKAAASDQGGTAAEARLPFCGDLAMRIGRDGTWYYQGSPIGRPAMVKLFASVLRREADGSYWLVTPYERGRIEVEDLPFVAVDCEVEGNGRNQRLRLRSNVDDWVTADAAHPLRFAVDDDGRPLPSIAIRPGLEARILRAVFYRLVELAEPDPRDGQILGLWSDGVFFPIGSTR